MNLEKICREEWGQWQYRMDTICTAETCGETSCASFGRMDSVDYAEFVVMANKAFGIQMRRGWMAERFSLLGGGFGWKLSSLTMQDIKRNCGVIGWDMATWNNLLVAADPFTALVEAEKWYVVKVEKKPQ